MNKILQAAKFAETIHKNQKRKYSTNVPYIVHPARVAGRCALLPYANEDDICVGFLHDTVEDTKHNKGVIADLILSTFGYDVYEGVIALTKYSKFSGEEWAKDKNRETRWRMDLERLRTEKSRWHNIKILDRIDNLNSFNGADPAFKKIYLRESRELLETMRYAHDNSYPDALLIIELMDLIEKLEKE